MTAQQLKNSILLMAVQGKLVPQDPNDEPASVLLERIHAEKERLIKEKKIKREKNPSVIFKGVMMPFLSWHQQQNIALQDYLMQSLHNVDSQNYADMIIEQFYPIESNFQARHLQHK